MSFAPEDPVIMVYGNGFKADLARKGWNALAQGDGMTAKDIAEKLLSLSENVEKTLQHEKEKKFALRMLGQANLYLNDSVATQGVVAQLNTLVNRMEDSPERTYDLCSNFILSGYAQLQDGNSEHARIAGEQAVDSAARLPDAERAKMRSLGLTLQAYAYLMQDKGEISQIAADEKLRTLEESFSDPNHRAQARLTALGLKALAFLNRRDIVGARKAIAQMEPLDGDSTPIQALSGFADIAEGKYDEAYATALALCNQSMLKGGLNHEGMLLLRSVANKSGHDREYADYVSQAKSKGIIRRGDTTYDPIGSSLDPEEEAALQQELEDTVGRYTRSRISKTAQIISPIDGNAARVVGLNPTPGDERSI